MLCRTFLLLLPFVYTHDSVTITVTNNVTSSEIPSNFAGFSIEVHSTVEMIGKAPDAPRKPFAVLLNHLRMKSDDKYPTIRIGGNSADESWWNPSGKPKPKGISYSITQYDLASYQNFSDLTNSISGGKTSLQYILDTDLRVKGDPYMTVDYLQAVEKYFHGNWSMFAAVEIGNEPDCFALSGHNIRPSDWTFDDYLKNFKVYVEAVYKEVPSFPTKYIEGATFSYKWKTNQDTKQYCSEFNQYLQTFCDHIYPLSVCSKHDHPTISDLLNDKAAEGEKPLVAGWAGNTLGTPLVIGESNSVSCGGKDGVSNVYAAALWSIDYMFNLVAAGAQRVNFHGGPQSLYAAINFPCYKDKDCAPQVQPLYYGMIVFTEATANMSKLVDTKVDSSNEKIKVWAVTGSYGYRVVIIHKDQNAHDSATITVKGPLANGKNGGTGHLALLTAPSVDSKNGIKWAGQTWDGSKDGNPSGHRTEQSVDYKGGGWGFELQPTQVAILTLP